MPSIGALGQGAGVEVGELRAREERGVGVIARGPREPEAAAEQLEGGDDRGRQDDERHEDLEQREALVARAARDRRLIRRASGGRRRDGHPPGDAVDLDDESAASRALHDPPRVAHERRAGRT